MVAGGIGSAIGGLVGGGDERKMDYQQVEAMIDALKASASKLRELQQNINGLAGKVQSDQILVGDAGQALEQGLKSALIPAVERLATKLDERAGFLQQEEQHWKDVIAGNASIL
jgi:hypothetical protein